MSKIIVIVNLHSRYKDVAEVFVELLQNNWNDCPYKIVFAIDKKIELNLPGEIEIFSEDSSLPNNILQIIKKYDADYAICMLGDAFVINKVKTGEVIELMRELQRQRISYCNLFCKNASSDYSTYEFISKKNYYDVSFIAFIASKRFINDEFVNNISDLQFEEKYLQISSETKSKDKYTNLITLKKDYFNIIHGIHKGKWIRSAKRKLKRISRTISKSERKSLSIVTSIYIWIMLNIMSRLPYKIRYYMKYGLKKIGFKFVTRY